MKNNISKIIFFILITCAIFQSFSINSYALYKTEINTDELIYRLKKIGVKRVKILSPVFTKIDEHEVAIIESDANIVNKGTEI